MGFFDRLFGTTTVSTLGPQAPQSNDPALERYRYLLRTAPPDAVEQAHAEAFAALTPQQRVQATNALNPQLAEPERIPASSSSDPNALARAATRAEMARPGSLERTFGGAGGSFGGTLMSSIAGTFIGSAIAHQFLGGFNDQPAEASEPVAAADESSMDDSSGGDDFGGFDD